MSRSAELAVRVPSPLVELDDPRLASVRVLLKRDDLIHPTVSGNKWRKLKYLLRDARAAGARTLLTFGGAYSNHVRAVAACGAHYGMATVGVIRGEERPYNDQLAACVADGMHLHYLDRGTYRRKTDDDVIAGLRERFGDFYLIPEGGTTPLAFPGCAELVAELQTDFDLVLTAVGTGGTLAGIAAALDDGQRAIGISALRGAYSLDEEVATLHETVLGRHITNWSIDHRFHHGGFARITPELRGFLDDFAARHDVRLEPVYVGKMMFALYAMAASGEIPASTVVIAVVTGPEVRASAPAATAPT